MYFTNKFLNLAILLIAAFSLRDLRTMDVDLTDPSSRDVYPVGVVNDVYVHFDIDPTVIQHSSVGGEQEIVDYLMSLTDVWNRDTFNPANFNLVVSSFSENEKNTANDVMLLMQTNKVLRTGEQHIWVHVTDYMASSIAGRFGMYRGEDNAYAIVATFNGYGFTHGERTTGAHEIGHLFGLDHTHVLSLSYRDEVSHDIDYCGGGPNGKDCSTKPTYGGTVMSYCQECPDIRYGGGFYSPKPLTSFHPFQIEKIQEHYQASESNLAKISWPKLRTFIPESASRTLCAHEHQSCRCNGVVYFGPTITATNPRIFAVTESTSQVDCRSGSSESFPDVFHDRAKSCYCDQGATLTDVHYLPTTVEFQDVGTGACQFECPYSRSCSWESVGYMTFSDQPEWKCKQECLDRTKCHAFNWRNGNCRLYQQPPIGTLQSGTFARSTCWSRPQGDGRVPVAKYTIRGGSSPVIPPSQWGPWDEWSECDASCGEGSRTRVRTCNGKKCVGSSVESEDCNLDACDECKYIAIDSSECPSSISRLPDCKLDISDGALCEADYKLAGVDNFNINNCPGGYDVFRYVCGGEVESQWGPWDEWSECDVSCGDGSRSRARTCNGENCIGVSLQTEECDLEPCVETDECEYIAVDASDCPDKISALPDCISDLSHGDLCEADHRLPNVPNHQINNCRGGYDVFRYLCGGEGQDTAYWGVWSGWSDCSVDCGSGVQQRTRQCVGSGCTGESTQTRQCTRDPCESGSLRFENLGRGICRSPTGGVVRGWGGWPKTADQCRRACERQTSCIGYTAVTTGRDGTCYVHGNFNSRPSGWFDAKGNADEIGRQPSGHYNLACYKLL